VCERTPAGCLGYRYGRARRRVGALREVDERIDDIGMRASGRGLAAACGGHFSRLIVPLRSLLPARLLAQILGARAMRSIEAGY